MKAKEQRKVIRLAGALWSVSVTAIGCGEPLHVGRVLEFEIPAAEWAGGGDSWHVVRSSDETDGQHTYADFLEVSNDHVLDEVWLERSTIVSVEAAPDGAMLTFEAVLTTGDTVELADGSLSTGELHLSEGSGDLLQASSSFGTPSLEFRFELSGSSPPTGAMRLDADFHSKATRGGP